MNELLNQKTKEWMQLERRTLEQRKEAEQYYADHLMKLIEEDFIERNRDRVYEEVDYIIVSVGTSYEPVVLDICLFKPKKILFLYTTKSEMILGKIVNYCKLDPSDYEKRLIGETDPISIYREIKSCYLKWHRPSKMYIDFTGGTKAMSAAAALAGAVIDVQLVYIGSNDFLVDFRKPNPGSEEIYYINNPLSVFGDLEIEKALSLFSQFNYSGAKEKLMVLKEDIPDPIVRQELNFVYLLACSYEAWDSLDFITAYKYIQKLTKELDRDRMMHPTLLLTDFYGELKEQEMILRNLHNIPGLISAKRNMDILKKKEIIIALMFTMLQNASIREEQEKLDMATLLYYRLLEMIEQRRLSQYSLFVSRMDYSNMKYNVKNVPEFKDVEERERLKVLKERYQSIKEAVFGRKGNDYLPDPVSLLEGFVLLAALGDPIIHDKEGHAINTLKKMRSVVYLRNNSIFAHGLGPVEQRDYMKFKSFVRDMFFKFCKLERIDHENYLKKMKWVDPMKSRNYVNNDDSVM